MDLCLQLLHGGLYLLGSLAILLAAGLWYVRPFPIDPKLPGPKRHPIFGVTFEDESTECFDEAFEWAKWPTLSVELSRRWDFRTWGGPTLNIGFGGAFFNVVSPECLQYILKDNFSNYEKGKLTESFRELMGSAVFTTDGDIWKFHRKIVATVLSKETVRHAAVLMKYKLAKVGQLLKEKSEIKEVFDFQDLCYKAVFDVFAKLSFGVELKQVDTMLKESNESDNQKMMDDFSEAFDKLQYYTHLRFNDLLWQFKQKYHIGEREQKVVQCRKVIDDFAFGIIRKALERPSGGEEQQHVIHQFIEYCRKENEKDPTEQELRDFVMTFVLAGRDTTAVGLAWTIFELTKHPAIVSSIREEVDRLQSEFSEEDHWSYNFVDKLNYTLAVVMEALRLHSPAPDNFRFAIKDDKLPDGTIVPAKSLVMYSIYTINHSEKVWGDTANSFDPERFVKDRLEPSPLKYPTFNAGPRLCPGKPLALMELKMAVAYLTSKFDFEDACQHSGDFDWKLVLAMKDGFQVRATPCKD